MNTPRNMHSALLELKSKVSDVVLARNGWFQRRYLSIEVHENGYVSASVMDNVAVSSLRGLIGATYAPDGSIYAACEQWITMWWSSTDKAKLAEADAMIRGYVDAAYKINRKKLGGKPVANKQEHAEERERLVSAVLSAARALVYGSGTMRDVLTGTLELAVSDVDAHDLRVREEANDVD